jgi:hypothetical protein
MSARHPQCLKVEECAGSIEQDRAGQKRERKWDQHGMKRMSHEDSFAFHESHTPLDASEAP